MDIQWTQPSGQGYQRGSSTAQQRDTFPIVWEQDGCTLVEPTPTTWRNRDNANTGCHRNSSRSTRPVHRHYTTRHQRLPTLVPVANHGWVGLLKARLGEVVGRKSLRFTGQGSQCGSRGIAAGRWNEAVRRPGWNPRVP